MAGYLRLAGTALIPVIASVLLYLAEKKTSFRKWNEWVRQLIIGAVFGGIAVLGTEFGVQIVGVTMNARDAAPVCAGLLFGAPAGILAGLIGGVERFIRAPWVGEYTKIACSFSTLIAGLFAAWLRKFMFDNKKPGWIYGLATGVIVEVLHMLMVFLTNMNDARNAFTVVHKCAIPMILSVGCSVLLAVTLVSVIGKDRSREEKKNAKLSNTFQQWLMICVLIAFALTSTFTFFLQKTVTESQTENLLDLTLRDVKKDITDASDANLLSVSRSVEFAVSFYQTKNGTVTAIDLASISRQHDVAEINVIDENGVITCSTNPEFVGFDMHSGAQAAAFLVLLRDNNVNEYVQAYQPTTFSQDVYRKYAGIRMKDGGFVQVGYDAANFQADLAEQLQSATRNRHVGENGGVIILDQSLNIVSELRDGASTETNVHLDSNELVPEGTVFHTDLYGETCDCMFSTSEGYYIVSFLPQSETTASRDMAVYVTGFMEVLVFAALFILIYFLIKRLIVDNIERINTSLSKITGGNLNEVVDVRTSEEFASLSDDINSTVLTLRRYIKEAEERIDKELEFAKTIQHSALPNVFPKRSDCDVWAGMKTAKEVGGDFYDVYLLDENHIAFLIADVSGKGIPAAMFMMTAKTMIRNLAETGASPDEVFTNANGQLCANNEAGMFVTAWMGILDLQTGDVRFVNAGHNPPLLKRKDGSFEYLKTRAGFVLAGMDGYHYRMGEMRLDPGDVLFLYTDGVTEATDAKTELFGEERLLSTLNSIGAKENAEAICHRVKNDVDAFVGEAPQFDDITMLCLRYRGASAENET